MIEQDTVEGSVDAVIDVVCSKSHNRISETIDDRDPVEY